MLLYMLLIKGQLSGLMIMKIQKKTVSNFDCIQEYTAFNAI